MIYFLRITHLNQKYLIGKKLKMNMITNRTVELWRSFMPLRNQISNRTSEDLISLQVHPESYDLKNFNPAIEFEKWAAVEVSAAGQIPVDMESFIIPSGMYAVFLHRGSLSSAPATFQYIFASWLPDSGFCLDNRPHFEILGAKYKNDDPDSEEEIWIPVRNL
jgi:AraC family transcriptional regulator